MQRIAHEIAADQVIVVYVSDDVGAPLAPGALFGEIAADAAERAPFGWRITSMASMPVRQMGTTGNILFQSGGQYATQVAIAVLYSQGDSRSSQASDSRAGTGGG